MKQRSFDHESRVTITTTPTNTDRPISDALGNRNRNQKKTILTRAALKRKRTGFKKELKHKMKIEKVAFNGRQY